MKIIKLINNTDEKKEYSPVIINSLDELIILDISKQETISIAKSILLLHFNSIKQDCLSGSISMIIDEEKIDSLSALNFLQEELINLTRLQSISFIDDAPFKFEVNKSRLLISVPALGMKFQILATPIDL